MWVEGSSRDNCSLILNEKLIRNMYSQTRRMGGPKLQILRTLVLFFCSLGVVGIFHSYKCYLFFEGFAMIVYETLVES